jgi:tetratricopeptide (TPR) repeat protein
MGIKSRRAVAGVAVTFLLVAGGVTALYVTSNRREVTTSSAAAYEAYKEGVEYNRRYYKKEARVAFARALSLDPNFAIAMIRLADLSNPEQSKSLIERARRLRNRVNERERLWLDLSASYEKGSREERLKIARMIHEKYPDDVEAALILAGDEMSHGREEEALRIMWDLLAKDPNNAEVYNQIGYYNAWRGEYDKAIESFRKYQFMAPDQANPYDSLGEVQANSGHYDEAIANLNKALSLKPDFFESHSHLGVAYEGKGDNGKAIEHYLASARDALTDGGRMDMYAACLRVALYTGDRAVAKDVAGRVADLPKDKDTEMRKAYTEEILDLIEGRPEQAEKRLDEIKPKLVARFQKENHDPQRKLQMPHWNLLMALAKTRQGKTDEAIALYEQNANPPNRWQNFEQRRWVYEGRASLAELLARKGDLDRAEKLLAENRAWNPSWAPTRPAELVVEQLRRDKVLSASGTSTPR